MKKIKILTSSAILMGVLSWSELPARGAEGIIYKSAAAANNYCNLKFPAIREDTLYSDRPVLKDPRDGDIVDFYGPCDHDPLGREEVMRQRAEKVRERNQLEDNR